MLLIDHLARKRSPHLYRFEQAWLRSEDCREIVQRTWRIGGAITSNLNRVGGVLGEWGKMTFKEIPRRIVKKKKLDRLASKESKYWCYEAETVWGGEGPGWDVIASRINLGSTLLCQLAGVWWPKYQNFSLKGISQEEEEFDWKNKDPMEACWLRMKKLLAWCVLIFFINLFTTSNPNWFRWGNSFLARKDYGRHGNNILLQLISVEHLFSTIFYCNFTFNESQ